MFIYSSTRNFLVVIFLLGWSNFAYCPSCFPVWFWRPCLAFSSRLVWNSVIYNPDDPKHPHLPSVGITDVTSVPKCSHSLLFFLLSALFTLCTSLPITLTALSPLTLCSKGPIVWTQSIYHNIFLNNKTIFLLSPLPHTESMSSILLTP